VHVCQISQGEVAAHERAVATAKAQLQAAQAGTERAVVEATEAAQALLRRQLQSEGDRWRTRVEDLERQLAESRAVRPVRVASAYGQARVH
jgi:hypothetical protein